MNEMELGCQYEEYIMSVTSSMHSVLLGELYLGQLLVIKVFNPLFIIIIINDLAPSQWHITMTSLPIG